MKTGDHGTFTLGDSKIVGTMVRANGSFTEVQVDGAEAYPEEKEHFEKFVAGLR